MRNTEADTRTALEVEQSNGVRLSERDLVVQAASGNPEAFSSIYQKYERQLFRTAVRITNDVSDAEDVLQEAFLRAFGKIDTFRSASSLSTWLTRIVMNCAFMELRRRKHRRSISLSDVENGVSLEDQISDSRMDIEAAVSLEEQSRLLTATIAQLPPKLRAVMETYRTSEVTMAELAETHDTTLAAVKSRVVRARKMIINFRTIADAPRRPSSKSG